jgi:hypothetical protein
LIIFPQNILSTTATPTCTINGAAPTVCTATTLSSQVTYNLSGITTTYGKNKLK